MIARQQLRRLTRVGLLGALGAATVALALAACSLEAAFAAPQPAATVAPRSGVASKVRHAGNTLGGASGRAVVTMHNPASAAAAAAVRSLAVRNALKVDLTGKVALVAGVADASGYGWAIARELANAGATVLIGTWPPVLKMFQMTLKKSATEKARTLDDGTLWSPAKIYPLDATFDTAEDVPEEVLENKRYKGVGAFTIQEVVDQVKEDYGKVDILVHSLANGPEVTKPLMDTSRKGYLAASSASAYSLVSMTSRFAPLMPEGGSVLSLSYIASERVIPGYGGGMSSAKAQLESDTRTLAFEAGRKYGIRVNTISAGPLKSRAASAIGGDGEKTFIERAIDYATMNAPLTSPLYAEHVGKSALCLLTDLMAGVTGITLYVDQGMHAMGQSIDSPAFEGVEMAPPRA